MDKLFHLLTDLAVDPRKQTVFTNNPKFLMDAVRLSEVEQTAIMSKESTKIAALFVDELVPLAISATDPGPDPLPDPDPFPLPDPDPSPPSSPEA